MVQREDCLGLGGGERKQECRRVTQPKAKPCIYPALGDTFVLRGGNKNFEFRVPGMYQRTELGRVRRTERGDMIVFFSSGRVEACSLCTPPPPVLASVSVARDDVPLSQSHSTPTYLFPVYH